MDPPANLCSVQTTSSRRTPSEYSKASVYRQYPAFDKERQVMSRQDADNEYVFTSESVTEGHPDKIADQV